MSALVRIVDDRAVADSRDVAAHFNKRHDAILRSVDTFIKSMPELAHNFVVMFSSTKTANGANRNARRFDLDRKGFMLLVMGFTGAKALEVKSKWIDAFDAMERRLMELEAPGNDDAMHLTTSADIHDYTPALAVIREARQVFGRSAAQRLWSKLGLPSMSDHPGARFEAASGYRIVESIRDWLAQCTRPDVAAWETATDLYEKYLAWCDDMRVKPESQTMFGRTLQRMGFTSRKGPNGRMMRNGLGLVR